MFITRKQYERDLRIARAQERKEVLKEKKLEEEIKHLQKYMYDGLERGENRMFERIDDLFKRVEDIEEQNRIKESVKEIKPCESVPCDCLLYTSDAADD